MNKNQHEAIIDIRRLLFRRQFLLGPKEFIPNKHWSSIQLQHEFHLSVHKDLPFTSVSSKGITVTLIGQAIDPFNPQKTESNILHYLISNFSEFDLFIKSTVHLVGRWVVIFQNQDDTYLFTDPCGFRQVFYHFDGMQVWCGSQPELIKTCNQLSLCTKDINLSFLKHPGYVQKESQWVGSTTLYENCFHLMPNHYLSINRMDQIRFYPKEPINNKNTSDVVELVCKILQGTMTALTARHKVSLALTAGWDSRVLLAASKHVSEHIEYFVYSLSDFKNNSDIWVPDKISKKLGINFVVKHPTKQLPGWFNLILSQNVTCARFLPKTCIIYDKLIEEDNRININGNASEICRNYFDKRCKLDLQNVSSELLATKMFGKEPAPLFVIREIDQWKDNLNNLSVDGINILDFLYWEQRLGNWGAQYPAEQDIAVEEISPFNCRMIIESLSSLPRKLRAAPEYPVYKELIQYMWPETLEFPINPQSMFSVIKNRIDPYMPSSVIQIINKLKNKNQY